jgi:dienelactone hydrolase
VVGCNQGASWRLLGNCQATIERSGFDKGSFHISLVAAQPPADLVTGAEFTAGANLTEKNVKADGTIFVPDAARRVPAVIVLVEGWPGADRGVYDASGRKIGDAEAYRLGFRDPRDTADGGDLAVGRFRDQAWRGLSQTCECALLHLRLGTIRPEASAGQSRNGVVLRTGMSDRVIRTAAEGGADALLVILQRLGEDSAHKELKDAPLILWGWSAPATFGTTFAELYPERTVAFIRYHGHLRGLSPNLKVLRNIPALLIAGGNDTQAGTDDAQTLWRSGRSAGAPWTFAIEPGATHGSQQSFAASQALIIPWVAAVLAQRLEPGSMRLRPVTQESGWLGNNQNAEVAPHATFRDVKDGTSWLPDEATARGWQKVLAGVK